MKYVPIFSSVSLPVVEKMGLHSSYRDSNLQAMSLTHPKSGVIALVVYIKESQLPMTGIQFLHIICT